MGWLAREADQWASCQVSSHVDPRPTGRFDRRGGHDRRGRTVAGGKPRTDPSFRGVILLTEGTGGVYASRRARWRKDGPFGRRKRRRRRAAAAALERHRRNRSDRGREREGRGPGGAPAHPENVQLLGGGGEGSTVTESWRRHVGRRRRRRDRRLDLRRPGPIERRRRKKRTRRSFCPGSICSGWPESTAAVGGAHSVHGHGGGGSRVSCSGGKRRGGEAASGGGGLYPPRGGQARGGARGEHGSAASMAPVFSLAPQ